MRKHIPGKAGRKAAGDAAGKSKRVIHQQEAWQRAAKARDDLHRKLAKGAREGPNGQRLDDKIAKKNLKDMRAERGLDPLEPHQVDFAKAQRTSLNGPPSEEMPICRSWCQRETNPEQYPDGVKYEGSAGPAESPWENTAGSRREHGRR